MQEKTLHYDWVDAAKGLGIIFVVLGHAIADTTQNVPIFGKIFQIIYSFHMPLFFFLSGFCGIKALQKRQLYEKEVYILERFKRLMIPYFFVGICYIPIKLFMADYVTKKIDIQHIVMGFLCGDNPNSQLWTLYVLFLDAIFLCVMSNAGKFSSHITFLLSLIMAVSSVFVDNAFLRNFMFETLFYILGALFRKNLPVVSGKVYFDNHQPLIIIGGGLLIALNMCMNIDGKTIFKILTAILGIMVVYGAAHILEKNKLLKELGRYSMDIYIMANIFQVSVRVVLLNKLGVNGYLCFLISFVAGIIFPVVISKNIVRKIPMTNKFVLGNF